VLKRKVEGFVNLSQKGSGTTIEPEDSREGGDGSDVLFYIK